MARPKDPEKKQLILNCALELIAHRGYHAVSVKDIATMAQISLGSMYTYFDSKETLINELFRLWKLRFMEFLGSTQWRQGLDVGQADLMSLPVMVEGLSPGRLAHKMLCNRLGGFIRNHKLAFLFLEAQLHADYLDKESLELEREATEAALAFYRNELGIDTHRASVESVQVLLSASFGAFVQLFKAQVAGLIPLSDVQVDELEGLLWAMIEGFKRTLDAKTGLVT